MDNLGTSGYEEYVVDDDLEGLDGIGLDNEFGRQYLLAQETNRLE